MYSRLPARLIALTAGMLLLLLVLSGCGSSTATIDPVAQAAVATTHAGGAQMSMRAQIELGSGSGPLTMTGTGDFNFARHEGEIVSEMSGLPASAQSALHASSLHFTELFANDVLFLESPLFAGKLPGSARWMKLDLKKFAQGAGLDPQSLSSGQSDPAEILDYLKASGGSVTKLGSEIVRGTPTTRYRGTIDLAKAAEKLPGSNRGQLKAAVEKLIAQTGSPSIPVEVWVDAHNLVRRMTMSIAEAPSGQLVHVSITLELFNFGATPAVNVPTGSEVFVATQSSLAGLTSGG
jgi:hypothetical protein